MNSLRKICSITSLLASTTGWIVNLRNVLLKEGKMIYSKKATVTGIWHENKECYWLYWAIALFILDKVSIQALKYILAFIINHARI